MLLGAKLQIVSSSRAPCTGDGWIHTHTHTLFLRLFSLRLLIPTIRSNTLERSFFFPYVGDGNKPLERPRSRRHVRRLRNKELGLNRAFLFLSFLRRKVYRNFDLDFYWNSFVPRLLRSRYKWNLNKDLTHLLIKYFIYEVISLMIISLRNSWLGFNIRLD